MADEAEKENTKLDRILESLDLLFERVTDVGVQQQQMKKQIDQTAQTVGQHSTEQQLMAKQIAETGRAVAQLTLNQMRAEGSTGSDSDTTSETSSVLKHFHKEGKSKSKEKEDQQQHNSLPKHHAPKVFCPEFNRDNPVIWKDKCMDYLALVDLEPKHWVRMAAVHFDGPAAQWLQVFRKKVKNPTWILQFVLAVENKFGKDDYRRALTDLLELKQTGSVEDYYKEFQELQFQVCMHNDGYGELFFASQFVNGLKEDIRYTVQSQVPEDVDRAVLLAKIQQKIVERGKAKLQRNGGAYKQISTYNKQEQKYIAEKVFDLLKEAWNKFNSEELF